MTLDHGAGHGPPMIASPSMAAHEHSSDLLAILSPALKHEAGGAAGDRNGPSSYRTPSSFSRGVTAVLNKAMAGSPSSAIGSSGGVRHQRRMSTGSVADVLRPSAFRARLLRSPTSSSRSPALPMPTSSGRLCMDVTGLRKAMLIRIWGVDRGPGLGLMNSNLPESSPKVGFFRRRASLGDDHAMIVIWVLDLESGVEWKARKTVADFLALREVCQELAPGLASEFPLRKSRTEGPGTLTRAKMERLETFLRKMGVLMDLSPSSHAYQLAKVLQDFVGATERVDVLTEMQHRNADVEQVIQVYGCDVLRRSQALQSRLSAFIRSMSSCDVAQTQVLKGFNAFVGTVADSVLLEHGDTLRGIVNMMKKGANLMTADEVDMLCLACLRRVVEAELFVPLLPRLYDKVGLMTDRAQEERLANKLSMLARRPQTSFGIPVSAISLSSWEGPVTLLRRIGDVTTLPSDKLDLLVSAVKEAHALYAREHPGSAPLGGDELLPIFIYMATQAHVPNLLGIKTLLEELCDPQRLLSESGYCLATLDAALSYILQHDEFAAEP